MVALAGVVQDCSFINVHEVEVDVLVVHQHLQNLNLFEGFSSHFVLHLTEAVEDGGSVVLVEGVDLPSLLDQQLHQFGSGVQVGGVENQVVQGGSFVHILEVWVHPQLQQMLGLLQTKALISLYNLDQGSLVIYCTKIYFAFVSSQNYHEIVFAVESSVEDWQGLARVVTVRVETVREEVLKDMFS